VRRLRRLQERQAEARRYVLRFAQSRYFYLTDLKIGHYRVRQ
jgi:hypothetical protein